MERTCQPSQWVRDQVPCSLLNSAHPCRMGSAIASAAGLVYWATAADAGIQVLSSYPTGTGGTGVDWGVWWLPANGTTSVTYSGSAAGAATAFHAALTSGAFSAATLSAASSGAWGSAYAGLSLSAAVPALVLSSCVTNCPADPPAPAPSPPLPPAPPASPPPRPPPPSPPPPSPPSSPPPTLATLPNACSVDLASRPWCAVNSLLTNPLGLYTSLCDPANALTSGRPWTLAVRASPSPAWPTLPPTRCDVLYKTNGCTAHALCCCTLWQLPADIGCAPATPQHAPSITFSITFCGAWDVHVLLP